MAGLAPQVPAVENLEASSNCLRHGLCEIGLHCQTTQPDARVITNWENEMTSHKYLIAVLVAGTMTVFAFTDSPDEKHTATGCPKCGRSPTDANAGANSVPAACPQCRKSDGPKECAACRQAAGKPSTASKEEQTSQPSGQTRGMGRGMGLGFGKAEQVDDRHAKDHQDFFYLIEHRRQIRRTVKNLDNGIETVTEADDAVVTEKIQAHVESMYERVENRQPIRMRDPLFREIFANADKIVMEVKHTDHGVVVKETSDDPYVAKLLQEHAKVVNLFIKNGFPELPKNHAAPAK